MLKSINPASTQLNLHGYIGEGAILLDDLFNAWKGCKKQSSIGRNPIAKEKDLLKTQLIKHVHTIIEVVHATYCPLYFIFHVPYTLFPITCYVLPASCRVPCKVLSGLTVCVCCIRRKWRGWVQMVFVVKDWPLD